MLPICTRTGETLAMTAPQMAPLIPLSRRPVAAFFGMPRGAFAACVPRLHLGHAAGLQLGDDLVGDLTVEVRPVVVRARKAAVWTSRVSATGVASLSRDFQPVMKTGAPICLLQGSATVQMLARPDSQLSKQCSKEIRNRLRSVCMRDSVLLPTERGKSQNGWKRDLDCDDEGYLRGSGGRASVAKETGAGVALVDGREGHAASAAGCPDPYRWPWHTRSPQA